MSDIRKSGGAEELASHSIRANHEIIADLARAKAAQDRITNDMNDIFGLMTQSGRVIKANSAFAKLMDIDDEDVYSTNLSALFFDESWDIIQANIKNASSVSDDPVIIEMPIDRKSLDSMYHWSFIPYSGVSKRRGAVFSFIGRDITALRDYERKLANIFSAIPLGILTVDRDLKVEWPYSAYTEVLLGRSDLKHADAREAIFGKSIPFFSQLELEGLNSFFEQIGGDELWYDMAKDSFPKVLAMAGPGSLEPYAWRGITYNPVKRAGVVEKVLIVLQDITERVLQNKGLTAKASREHQIAETIMDLEQTDAVFLSSCMHDVDFYLKTMEETLRQDGATSNVINQLHGIKGVARAVNLRAFKDLIHDLESKIKESSATVISGLQPDLVSRLHEVKNEWLGVRRMIAIFKPTSESESEKLKGTEASATVLRKRDAIIASINKMAVRAPAKMKASIAAVLEQTKALGRVSISTIEPKLWSFFDVTTRKLGKNANLDCNWGHSEIERETIPGVSEIFYHLLTNALDHGIESPEIRLENKKKATASIIISSETVGDTVNFTFEDDGAGLATNKIAEKAIKMHLIKSAQGMSEADIWSLVLLPGFSTAETVTDTSGRGVGLDAVNDRVKRLGGEGLIVVWSKQGLGLKFKFSIKL